MGRDTRIPRSPGQIAVEDDQAPDGSSYSISPLGTPWGLASSDSEKAEALAENLETQFQPVTDLSVPAVIEMVDVVLGSYFLSPASEPQLATPDEVHAAINCLKFSKAPGPDGMPNRALKHLPNERSPSLPISSMRFSAPITFHKRGSMLE